MNFDFLPYQLNADISDFKGNVEYISSDNGVDLYKAKDGFIKALLGFPVTMVNLYFFEGSLITVYCHLENSEGSFERLKEKIEGILNITRTPFWDNGNSGFFWKSEYLVLAIVISKASNKMYLYYSMLRYSVF
ncbi:MAG: hypothetical protein V9F46_05010 [Chitinophagaceae bacterium]